MNVSHPQAYVLLTHTIHEGVSRPDFALRIDKAWRERRLAVHVMDVVIDAPIWHAYEHIS